MKHKLAKKASNLVFNKGAIVAKRPGTVLQQLHSYTFLLTILPLIVLLPSFIKSGDLFYRITGIYPTVVSLSALFLLLGLRLVQKKPVLTQFWQKIVLSFTILLAILGIITSAIVVITYPNFIYSLTHIRVEVISYLLTLSLCIWLTQKDNAFFIKNAKKLLLFGPIVALCVSILMLLLPNNLLYEATREDNIVENIQFVALATGGISGIFVGIKLLKKKMWYGFFLLFIGLMLLGVAGEEISWGQRIFHFGNESLQRINYQNETNVHNIYGVHSTIPTLYAIIGFLGSIGALIANSLTIVSKNIKKYLIPRKELFFFFFIPFAYNAAAVGYGPLTEATELILYLGMTFFLLQPIIPLQQSKGR